MTKSDPKRRPDAVAAWATGFGIGTAAFMLTWIVVNRVAAIWLSSPVGPLVAMAAALTAGAVIALVQGWRLSRGVRV